MNTLYVEVLIENMTEEHKRYLEQLSLRYGIVQNRETIVRNLNNTKLIGRAFDHMIEHIPSEILLNVFTHEEAMIYKNNPTNGYIEESEEE